MRGSSGFWYHFLNVVFYKKLSMLNTRCEDYVVVDSFK